MGAPSKSDVKDFDNPDHPHYEKGYPHDSPPQLPKTFSITSAGSEQISKAGFKATILKDHEDKDVAMIEHDGSPEKQKDIEALGGICVHGSGDSFTSAGAETMMIHGPHLGSFVRLPSGHKIRFVGAGQVAKSEQEGSTTVAKEKLSIPTKQLISEHEALVDVLEHPTSKKISEEASEQKKELNAYRDIDQKLKSLRTKLKELDPGTSAVVEVSGKEIDPDGSLECEDCGSGKVPCDCFSGLSKPKIEFDPKGRRLKVMFKSEWSAEDQEAFMQDMKKRAMAIARKKWLK